MEIFRKKNTDTRVVFPILDADRDFQTGAADLDSEYASWDTADHGGAAPSFSDCTHEAVEIGATGVYYLDIDAAEINKDFTMIQVKTSTSGAKTVAILIRTLKTDAEVAEIGTPVAVDSGAATIAGMLTKMIDDNGGASFDATYDSLNKLSDAVEAVDDYVDTEVGAIVTAIGTPVAVDGGAATLAGMLTKIVDDNGGADFDATTDSLKVLSDAVEAIDDYVDTEVGAIVTAIGTPVAIDGGAASVAGMLLKMIDDNGGSDFDATTDSLKVMSDAIEAVDDYVDTEVGAIVTAIGTPIAVDSGAATLVGMLLKIIDDNGGSDFDATYDSLNKLSDAVEAVDDYVDTEVGSIITSLGTPVAIDGGAATLAGMLLKMIDDNGGADFDATTDSLKVMSDAVETVDDYVDTEVGAIITAIGTPVAIDGGAATLAGMITKIVDDNDGGTYDATNDSLNRIAATDAAIKAQTDQLAFSGGDVVATLDSEEVALVDGAITAAKIGSNAITAAKVAADVIDAIWDELQAGHTVSDSFGEYLNCPITDATRELGMGILACIYSLTLSDNGLPISNAHVWVSTDAGHTAIVAHGITDAFGNVTFNLDPGTYYLWRHKNGVNFTNPMSMTVSEVSTSAIGTGTLTMSITTARVRVVTYAGSS